MTERNGQDLDIEKVQVSLLRSRTDLLEETARLINAEWPRSMGARLSSLSSCSLDEALPCSLVMTDTLGRRVIGYARLVAVIGNPKSALIETVIVSPKLRGCGLGRRLMKEAESHVCSIGKSCLHLSTHDKEEFYSHLGYERGPVVSPMKKCMRKLDNLQTDVLLENVGEKGLSVDPENDEYDDKSDAAIDSAPPLPPCAPPPPVPHVPPPPLPIERQAASRNSLPITWMMKHLISK